MKKSTILKIVLVVVIILIVATFFYNIRYLRNFHKHTREPTELERQEAIEIIKENLDVEVSQIKFGKVYKTKLREFIQVEIFGEKKKEYFINLEEKTVVKK